MSGTERPNDNMRAAILEVLDIADRAGVTVGIASYRFAQDATRPSLIQVQGGPAFGQMSASDAVTMASCGNGSTYRGPGSDIRYAAVDFWLPVTGVQVTIICEPQRSLRDEPSDPSQ